MLAPASTLCASSGGATALVLKQLHGEVDVIRVPHRGAYSPCSGEEGMTFDYVKGDVQEGFTEQAVSAEAWGNGLLL